MSKNPIFGTDGIRGLANEFPVTPEIILKVGQALGALLREKPPKISPSHMVVLGKDTRISGYMVEQVMASGLNSMGVGVHLTGPLPTPGVGFLVRNMRVDAGIMISASHNPYEDNGVKIFDSSGFKISDEMEKKIEQMVFHKDLNALCAKGEKIGRTRRIDDAVGRYLVYAKNSFPLNLTLEGLRVVLDCAHGACYKVAPKIFEELGAKVTVLGDKPDGFNINKDSGSLSLGALSREVMKQKAHVGVSLDGDGDRLIMTDEKGRAFDGDHILVLSALCLKEKDELSQNTVVTTQMSNYGVESFLSSRGIRVERVPVGDKYVVSQMRKKGYTLGGEPSGHIIDLRKGATGDGCVAALGVLSLMVEKKKKLSELRDLYKASPQKLSNVKVKKKKPLDEIPGYESFLEGVKKDLGEGRIFVRYSGTEPLLRILVEGACEEKVKKANHFLESFFKKKL